MLRVTADLHLRLDVPECRGETEEEWLRLQLESLSTLVQSYEGKIAIAGDIFHRAIKGNSPRLVNNFLWILHDHLLIMPGNHDLQMRNDNIGETSYGTLSLMIPPLSTEYDIVPYGEEKIVMGKKKNDLLFMHRLVFSDSIPPDTDGILARDLLDLYPDYKVIVAGDNHEGFIYEKNGRKVLVPGSMTIQSAKGIGRKCYFYDIDEETFEITKHEYPDKGELVTREHLDKNNEREERLTAFVEALKKGGEVAFDFESNVIVMLNSSKIDEETKTTVKEFLYA